MAERAQADQDIELGRGLRNQMTQQAGEHFVAAEVNRRGAVATAFSGNALGIDIIAFDGTRSREVYTRLLDRAALLGPKHDLRPQTRLAQEARPQQGAQLRLEAFGD